MQIQTSRQNLITGAFAGSFIVYLLSQAYLGTFGRFLADDFCHAEIAMREGVIGSTLYWYQNWTGRFVNFTLLGMIDVWGRSIAPFIPGLVLIAWLLILTWTGYQILSTLRVQRPALIALCVAALILYASVIGRVNVLQSLFWMPGLVGYSLALLWLTLLPGLLIYMLRHAASRRFTAIIISITFVGSFIAGGTSEVYDLFQIAVMCLMVLGFRRFAKPDINRRALLVLGAGLLGAIIVFVIMLAAPGNAIRQAALGAPLPLHLVFLRTLLSIFVFFASTIAINTPVPILLALVVPMIIFWGLAQFDQKPSLNSRTVRRLLGVSAGIAFVLIFICIFPPIYSTSAAPDARLYSSPVLCWSVRQCFGEV